MSGRLSGRTAIVTGAARGIGATYAARLMEEGAQVVVADITVPSSSTERLLEQSPTARFVQADVTAPERVAELVDHTLGWFGQIDVLVNNAALFTTLDRRPFDEIALDEWRQVLEVNVTGTFLCCRAVAPAMRARGYGKIINVGSNVAHKGLPLLLHYVTSKGAVHALTRALARELGPAGIRVNAVAPGYVMHEGTADRDAGRNEQVRALRALGMTETPDDLAGTIVYLASADSDFLTGQTLIVDGGEVFA